LKHSFSRPSGLVLGAHFILQHNKLIIGSKQTVSKRIGVSDSVMESGSFMDCWKFMLGAFRERLKLRAIVPGLTLQVPWRNRLHSWVGV
jgi:hypothetical protein